MARPRVAYLLYQFPQISETYMRSEMEAMAPHCDIRVFATHAANTAYDTDVPFTISDDPVVIRRGIAAFDPHVLHTHWLPQLRELAYMAGYFGDAAGRPRPFSIRAHSFDVLEEDHRYVAEAAPLINSDLCLGVLTFPFTRPIFRRAGVRDEKIIDSWPVINYARFHDESPNGPDVMNVGATLPKKQMQNFLKIARMVPSRRFVLYPMGYQSKEIDRLNSDMGHPVAITPPVPPQDMLKEYKKSQWLLYTAHRDLNSVGWPLAVAEAQAAGVGVCFPRLRPDLEDYIGPAGFLYDTLEEAASIVSQPFPEEKRRLGFAHARRSDVFEHGKVLLQLWQRAAAGPTPVTARQNDGLPDWGAGETTLERTTRARALEHRIQELVPRGGAFIEAGDATGWRLDHGRTVLPFLERDGQYWGPPDSDDTAIAELERMRDAGATRLVFRSPSMWWLDSYSGFARHLRSSYPALLDDGEAIVFDLDRR